MKLRGMSDAEMDDINAEIRKAYNEGTLCMIASELVLAREWLTPEEDEAWKDFSLGAFMTTGRTQEQGQ